jgi:hypothetical protein
MLWDATFQYEFWKNYKDFRKVQADIEYSDITLSIDNKFWGHHYGTFLLNSSENKLLLKSHFGGKFACITWSVNSQLCKHYFLDNSIVNFAQRVISADSEGV